MFFRHIEEFEKKFKFLDRINILVFNVWRDKNAEAFKDGEMKLLESFYRSYISEMREKGNEMLQLKNSIDQQIEELKKCHKELYDICNDPESRGCCLYRASGYLDEKQHSYGTEGFVLKFGQDPEMYARQCCHRLETIDSVSLERML